MLETNSPSKTLSGGVRFVLFGFDPINERKVRSKLIDGGGVDVGQYSQSCTHVIVDKIVYDDPECVAARNDGKKLVTGLWVDHSFDIGMPVDTTSVLYRPLKDLNGIPGAKSLIICLTGYQRHDRDDIMTMVGLMGAQFSKPLVANKVTHLICYKFEGEKYELAKKMKRIKLVNHCWLEDSLRDWELLPEANYNKSGYELEMMEAEAKDSEEEAEDTTMKQSGGRNMNKTPCSLKAGIPDAGELSKVKTEVAGIRPISSMAEDASNPVLAKGMLTPSQMNGPYQASLFEDVNVASRHGCQETGVIGDAASVQLPDPHDRTPQSAKVENRLASISKSAEKPSPPGAMFNAISYLRKTPRKSTVSMFREELSGNLSGSPKENVGDLKVNDIFDSSSSKVKHTMERIGSVHLETPCKNSESHNEEESTGILPQKRVTPISVASSKSQKIGHNSKESIKVSPLIGYKTQGLEHGLLERENNFLPGNDGHSMDGTAGHKSCARVLAIKSSSLNKKSLFDDLPVSRSVTYEITEEKAHLTSSTGLTKSIVSRIPNNENFGTGRSTHVAGEAKEPQNQMHDVELSSLSNRKSVLEKSDTAVNLDSLQGGNDKFVTTEPLKKKMFAKKTLGSRAKLNNTANQKGSICSSKVASKNDFATCLSGGKVTAVQESANELEITPPTGVGMKENAPNFFPGVDAVDKTESVDNETQAPEEKDDYGGLENTLNQDKSKVVELSHKADAKTGMKSGVQQVANDSKASMHNDAMASEDKTNGSELNKAVSGKKSDLGESISKGDLVKGKINKGKKRISGMSKVETVPAAKEITESKKDVDEEETQNGKNTEKKEMEKDKSVLHPAAKIKSTVSVSRLGNSMEKENRPVLDGGQDSNRKPRVKNTVVKSTKTPMKINKKSGKGNSKLMPDGELLNKAEAEPAWFVLSGHRLQRKEFQQVIRRLKGRCCRDSHQWSYQGTHFITPDLRRTEKLFAAAASGRWILKSDYISACSQAGSFLPEEPFEWHKNGLSEDGAINLEAPRKWRLLRQKTGHGAFFGMRIVVYGVCIAPPLDTLKRVVKAGDGTILATSPPYTRFLESGIDFAIISPGMPRVDLWIQEFLKHEIPCVVADYLVEYVCKPGYSLERHVLYNTHAWAEKSFSNLLIRAEEVAEDLSMPDDSASDDVICQVCGSSDRGEVMLLCGDDSGSIGCGVGTHIDCCDPPLEDVPDGDWFCPKCRESRNGSNPSKKRKKGTSSSKRK